MLNVERDKYFYGDRNLEPAQWVGAVIKVTPPQQAPMPETGTVRVEPNTQTKIVAKRVRNVIDD